MKNVLLSIVLGSTTLLSAAPIDPNENVRPKRDNIHQRTQSQEQKRQPQREIRQRDSQRVETQRTKRIQEQPQRTRQYQEQQRQPRREIDQRDRQRIEEKRTIRTQEQSQRTRQYQEQQRQPRREIDQRDRQRVEEKRTIRTQEQPQRTRQYQEQQRRISQPAPQRELQRERTKRTFTPQERERLIIKRVQQRDSVQRTFRTHAEFKHARPHLRTNYYHIYHKRDYIRRPHIRQTGLVYFINSWYFIYQNRHAPFYDQFGYFYGFFNQFGYFFEGIFYAYDRYYTYEDRLRGRGLFDDRYYEPYLEDGYDDWYDIYEDPYYEDSYYDDPYYYD